jgi:hypothetical protein
MTDETRYRWWVTKCSTEGCGTTLLLDVIAPNTNDNKYRVYVFPKVGPFKITCPECNIEHEYRESDVYEATYYAPSANYRPNLEFRKAVQALGRKEIKEQ